MVVGASGNEARARENYEPVVKYYISRHLTGDSSQNGGGAIYLISRSSRKNTFLT